MTCPKCKKSRCECVAKDGQVFHIPLMLKDGAPVAAPGAMTMTDTEQRAMRDSIKGQPLWKAKESPLYADMRGLTVSGMDAREYFAILDGARPMPHIGGRKPTQEAINDAAEKLAAQNAYERRIAAGRHTDAAPVDRSAPQPHFGGGAPALQGDDNGQAAYEARLRAGRNATQDNGQSAYEARLRNAWQ